MLRVETSPPAISCSWAYAKPNRATFDIPPIRERVQRALAASKVSVDPFAKDRQWATYSCDIDHHSKCATPGHEARDFLRMLVGHGVKVDLFLIDPPYSPTQIKRVYQRIRRRLRTVDTQNATLMREVRDLCNQLATPGAQALVCGWNSVGMALPWIREEVLTVCHGGAHNDTICTTCRFPR
jgi:hypothetical protein